MKNYNEFKKLLSSIDNHSYSLYKKIKGTYNLEKYIISIDHVQPDPFAPPSKCHIIIPRKISGFPDKILDSKYKKIAVSDFLTRTFGKNINHFNKNKNGTGKSGLISINKCGQEMLERTSVLIKENYIEVRFEVGLPSIGRRVLGKSTSNIFFNILPKIIHTSLIYNNINKDALKKQINLILDQQYIRTQLKKMRLISFISDGSILPRKNGISDKPMLDDSIAFKSPENFRTKLMLPNNGLIEGMGIPEGITLIVGGGYHGKSTLLKAIELGVYNHIPGDGREFVITRNDAVKIRAEDGRSIQKVNISPFINNLPNNKYTSKFSTDNASGSTSQAANVMEALESGTKLLLIDEDTSATNFMIRDGRMQKLISKDKEPITPFIDKIRPLYNQYGVSTILIVGGCGDYFDVADQIIMMDEYIPKDVTKKAREIANNTGYRREISAQYTFGNITPRIPLKSKPIHNTHNRIKSKGKYCIIYGKSTIDLHRIEQLVDESQTNCIALILGILENQIFNNKISISQAVNEIFDKIENYGLDSILPCSGNLAIPRKYEICAAINRYRKLSIK